MSFHCSYSGNHRLRLISEEGLQFRKPLKYTHQALIQAQANIGYWLFMW